MENYRERLVRLENAVETGNLNKLKAADKELAALLKKRGQNALIDELNRKARVLYLKNRAKAFLLYYAETFSKERKDKMAAELTALIEECEAEFSEVKEELFRAADALRLASEIAEKYENEPSAETDPTTLGDLIGALKSENLGILSEEFGFLKTRLTEYLSDKIAAAEGLKNGVSDARYGADYKRAVSTVAEFAGFEYVPKIRDAAKRRKHALIVAATPFCEDAELYVRRKELTDKAAFIKVDLRRFAGASAEARAYAFDRLKKEDCKRFAFFGFNHLSGAVKAETAERIAKLSETAERAFVHDSAGRGGVFNLLVAAGAKNPMTILIAAPDYREADAELFKLGFFTEAGDRELFRACGAYLGFAGLNELIRAGRAGWRRYLRRRALKESAKFIEFYEELTDREAFLDAGWGFDAVSLLKPRGTRNAYTFDYDRMREYRPDNLREILEGDFSFRAKCGMAVKYCVLFGEDDARWKELLEDEAGRAEREKRLVNAVNVLASLFACGQEEFEILIVSDRTEREGAEKEELSDNAKVAARNSVGGVVVLKESEIASAEEALNAVLLEMYRRFEYLAAKRGHENWFFTELGVTAERVAEWAQNFEKYPKSENARKYRATEADARIFAREALNECAARWRELNLK